MTNRFVELTRIDHNPAGDVALVNLDNVAWLQRNEDGTTWVVFAAAVPHERANGVPLSISVRESLEDLSRLVGATRRTDRDAIAQAWLDQQARRGVDDERDE